MNKQNIDNSLPWQNLNKWLSSISVLLGEISTVEISTTIVDEITEDIFLPYEVYQAIYDISPHYLAELGIHPSVRDRYLRLRRQLELQYALLAIDEDSSLYDPQLAPSVKNDLPILAKESTTWEDIPCRLPPPTDYGDSAKSGVLLQLLAEPNFKTTLRQIGKIKASLDRRNAKLSNSPTHYSVTASELTYARTEIQLDGKITNLYAAELMKHPQQKEILGLHKQGIEAGEQQWRKLLQFVTEIVQRQQKFQHHSTVNDSKY